MIAFLRGRLAEKHPDRVVVDVAGVGYDVHVPLSTFYRLPEPGDVVALRIHTHVREDTLALYGFGTPFELQIFEKLIDVSGIGPRLALAVLSGIEPAELARAIQDGNIVRLTSIPGVGKKTAERIALELRDKLAPLVDSGEAPPPTAGFEGAALRDDLLSALVNLGYHRPLAEKAVDAALKKGDTPTLESLLKLALRELARA